MICNNSVKSLTRSLVNHHPVVVTCDRILFIGRTLGIDDYYATTIGAGGHQHHQCHPWHQPRNKQAPNHHDIRRSFSSITSNNGTTTTSSSSSSSPPRRRYLLRRPPSPVDRYDSDADGSNKNIQSNPFLLGDTSHNPMIRPNAVMLFPGADYNDDDDTFHNDNWDDDDDFPNDVAQEHGSVSGSIKLNETEQLLLELKRRDDEMKKKKERWIENAKEPIRTPQIDERGRAYGRGGRKTASARVWIQAGFGEIVINRRPFDEYFERMSDRDLILQPFVVTETCGLFDVQCMVQGGGLTGQAGAIRHGVANALNHYLPDLYRIPLKYHGYLTRDARKVERKKIGHKKARKSPQWVRR